jgi:hypothetical protein
MCPFCLATVGLIVAGAVSTGGLAALAVKVSCKRNGAEIISRLHKRRKQDDNEHDRKSENSIAR